MNQKFEMELLELLNQYIKCFELEISEVDRKFLFDSYSGADHYSDYNDYSDVSSPEQYED